MIRTALAAAALMCAAAAGAAEPATAQQSAPAQQPEKKYTELYYQRAALFDSLGVDSTDIVFLGNSLTHGGEWDELLGISNAVNRGISGDTTEGIADRLGSITRGKPAKIFLMAGVNDVSHDLTADSVATSVLALIERIHAESPNTKVYLQSLLPINNSFGRYKRVFGKEQVIRDINTILEANAERVNATWINLYPLFTDADGNLRAELTNDGLHLLGPGYIIWRDKIKPYVTE